MIAELPVTKILSNLAGDNLLPAILFRTSRRQCDIDVERLSTSRRMLLSDDEQGRLAGEIEAFAEKYQLERSVLRGHLHYGALVTTGVGAHHAGQLLVWRLLLEELMSRGLLRMMIATGTVAAGVDFPARSAVITAHSKRGSEGFQVITSSEFQQMSGRAGRRGKDAVGICVVAPGPYCDARVLHEVSKRPPEPLRSAYFAAPSTVLNLLKFRNVDDLRFTVSRSLASFLDRKTAEGIREEARIRHLELETDYHLKGEAKKKAERRIRKMMNEADALQARQETLLAYALQGLEKLGYMEQAALSEKGVWAAELCTSLVLELGEAIQDRLFDDVTPIELAGLVAAISGDPHRQYFGLKANPLKKDKFRAFERIIARVRDAYVNPAASEIGVVPDAALTVMTWMESESWEDFSSLLRLAGVAEGDVSRLVTQTADHLNQISRLNVTHYDLANMAYEARKQILRPPLIETFGVE